MSAGSSPPGISGPDAGLSGTDDDEFDTSDPWASDEDQSPSLLERLDLWRRRYLPLPDEVVYEFLGEDEYVLHSDHPSFRAFLTQNVLLVVLVPIIGPIFVWFLLSEINVITITVFLVLDLIVAVLAFRRIEQRYTSYVITNLRLIRISGILSRDVASIPWTRMTGLSYKQSAWGRLLGYATIHIESANEESGLRDFSDINDPATFHQRLLDHVSSKTGQAPPQPATPTKGERRGLFSKRKERRRDDLLQAEAPERTRISGSLGAHDEERRPDDRGGDSGGLAGGDLPRASPPPRRPGGLGEVRGRPRRKPATGEAKQQSEAPTPPPAAEPQAEAQPEPQPGPAPAEPPEAPPAPPTSGEPRPPQPEPTPEPEPEPGPARRGLASWLRWPGAHGGDPGPAVPPRPSDAPPEDQPPRRARPGAQQRAPSKRPPKTIIVPRRRDQPRGGGSGSQEVPPWRRRTREIDG